MKIRCKIMIALSSLWSGITICQVLVHVKQVNGQQFEPAPKGKLIPEETCPQEKTFRTLNGISLQKCAEECHRRKQCTGLNFYHLLNQCELKNAKQTTKMGVPTVHSPCVFSDITTWAFPDKTICDGELCQDMERCDHLNTTSTKAVCSTKECGIPKDTEHAHLLSGMVAVGKTNRYECDESYLPKGIHRTTCLENGQWSVRPECTWFCARYTYNNGLNMCYFVMAPQSLYSADSACKVANGIILTITSSTLQVFVVEVMLENQISGLHIGLKSRLGSYNNFIPGEPNNTDGKEDCLSVLTPHYQWNDMPCTSRLPAICQVFY